MPEAKPFAATAAALTAYVAAFAPVHALAGPAAAALAIFPAVVGGWSFGPVAGATVGVASAVISHALLAFTGDAIGEELAPAIVGAIAMGTVGFFVGGARELSARLRREIASHQQLLSDRRSALDSAIASEQRLRQLLSGNPAVVFSVNTDDELSFISDNIQELLGVEPAQVIGDRSLIRAYVHPDDRHLLNEQDRLLATTGYANLDLRMRRATGEQIWVRKEVRVVGTGATREIIGYFTDITERKLAKAEAVRLSVTDRVTGLPNRNRLEARLGEVLTDHGRRVDLALVDIDGLDEVVAAFGTDAGDAVLRSLASRLHGAAGPDDLIAYVGKDKFAAIFIAPDLPAAQSAGALLDAFATPFMAGDHEVTLAGSVGVASAPEHATTADALFRDAEMALYDAKRDREPVRVYSADRDRLARAELELAGDLRHAVERGELTLHFQPVIDLRNRNVTHAEALVRWRHPSRGLVPPAEFIPIAEHTGLMRPITRWIIDEALRHCWAWHEEGLTIGVAANLSPRNLNDPDLARQIKESLDRYGLAPSLLTLEITESTVMSDPERALETLARLRAMGVRLAIDDFGTGYSSLAYLNRLPVDTIKVDRSFVKNLASDEGAAAIVRATVDLAHTLGFSVVAEGAENEDSVTLLGIYGCDSVQGFHFSRPLAIADFRKWMTSQGTALGTSAMTAGARKTAPSILVVDDQDVVRMTANLLLSRHGFNVLQAASGADALAMMRAPGYEIDAVLADVVMPEMDGKTLYAHVARMSPTVPVIFMSGHNAAALDLPLGAPFIAKPFTEQALLKTLQESLGVATASRAGLN
ncbi:MAG: hypothetical protein AUH85_15490 [Chloroflexi bacterium 13_1_40CM_4_68_4]|nr:MAG: hypothetical protein AUH85_15490 [Chloroflexi bacterium 13_1_40CM_4_68_4]